MNTTPITLLERLRQRNEQAAWERFVELYTPLLFTWARRIGLQETDAADLVQEVFGLLVHKLPEFVYDKWKSFRGWLRKVALNQWRAGQRKRARAPLAMDVDLDHLPAAPPEEAFWEQEYRSHLVYRAMEVMRADFQEPTWRACWECVVHSRSAVEVGAELGMTPGGVRAAKFRVLARLRQELDGLLE